MTCADDEPRRFLAAHPDGTIVALGEGLETQFWRVDNGCVTWLSGAGHGLLLPVASRVPALRRVMLSVFRARFESTARGAAG